jgi:hypothetical protein
LNRHTAADRLQSWGRELALSNEIPAKLPVQGGEQLGSNEAEETLRAMLDRAGLHGYQTGKRVHLGPPLGDTVPDFFYEDPDGIDPGICVYLDGMSERIHGNPETAARDRRIREQLRATAYQVVEIPYGHLMDLEQMRRHFFVIGRILLGRDEARRLREDASWFVAPSQTETRDEWQETIDLLDENWHEFATHLRNAGVQAPTDVHWDIPVNGRVSGLRAIMMWESDSGPLLVTEQPAPDGLRHVVVTRDYVTGVAAVQRMLDEAQ